VSTIRLASERDAEQMLEIYAPFCTETAVSFEVQPPTLAQMRARVAKTLTRYPWLVCEDAGRVLGYVYATTHRERAAYQWSVDVTAYVREGNRGAGIGRGLYTSLMNLLVLQGFYNAYAGITVPNPASEALHRAMGFDRVGVYRAEGYKLGAWHDVGWWHLLLRPLASNPAPPLEMAAARRRATWAKALGKGKSLLRA
jgi:phosphinothricin acetyltransferase